MSTKGISTSRIGPLKFWRVKDLRTPWRETRFWAVMSATTIDDKCTPDYLIRIEKKDSATLLVGDASAINTADGKPLILH